MVWINFYQAMTDFYLLDINYMENIVNCFFEVYSTHSDIRGLITTVISVLMALGIVLLTQEFINRRARKELLIRKIEQLYIASEVYYTKFSQLVKMNQRLDELNDQNNQTFPPNEQTYEPEITKEEILRNKEEMIRIRASITSYVDVQLPKVASEIKMLLFLFFNIKQDIFKGFILDPSYIDVETQNTIYEQKKILMKECDDLMKKYSY